MIGCRRLLYIPCRLTEIRSAMEKARIHETQLDLLALQYGKSLASPMNDSVKEVFIQEEEKVPQWMVTSLPLEINKIFLTWTNRTPYSGRDGGRCRYIDVGFPLGFLLGEIPTGQSLWHLHPGTRITTPWAGPQELGCPVHITCSRMSHGSSSLNSPQEESWRQVIFNKIISIKRCNV